MIQNNIIFNIMVNDKPVSEYRKDFNTYIEGRKGSEFKLQIINNNSKRILVVPSIDGLSVLDGKAADYNSSGYIINGFSSLIIDGWRISLEEVRKFFFTKKNSSYANKTNQDTSNLGVIGLAVFTEKVKPVIRNTSPYWVDSDTHKWWGPSYTYSATYNADYNAEYSAMSLSDTIKRSAVGTGMGDKISSLCSESSFDKEDQPFTVFCIYYYERKELERMGVLSVKSSKPKQKPFPGQFCIEV